MAKYSYGKQVQHCNRTDEDENDNYDASDIGRVDNTDDELLATLALQLTLSEPIHSLHQRNGHRFIATLKEGNDDDAAFCGLST